MRQLWTETGDYLAKYKVIDQILFILSPFFVIINVSKRLSTIISFENKCLKYPPMRQIQPETRESLGIFLNTNPIVFVIFIS